MFERIIGNGLLSALFSPASIPGLQLWLDATVPGSITSSGGRVSQWDDLSGNGRHVTAAGIDRPYTGATVGGLDAIDFRSAEFLSRGDSSGISGNPNLTIFLYYLQNSAVMETILEYGTSGNGTQCGIRSDNSYRYNNGFQQFSAPPTGLPIYATLQRAAGSQYQDGAWRANGVALSQIGVGGGANVPNIGTAATAVGARDGGSIPFDGAICRILIYTELLTSEQIAQVESWIVGAPGSHILLETGSDVLLAENANPLSLE